MTDRRLWTTVDCTCGKPSQKAGDAMSLEKDKSFSIGDALVDAVGMLAARVDGLEYQLTQLLSIVDAPLSPTESIERLRRLREEMI